MLGGGGAKNFFPPTGQLHKGGPGRGCFILLTASASEDIPVPGEKYTFANLELAQAIGDLEALESKKRRVIHFHLESLSENVLDGLNTKITQSLESVLHS